MVYTIKLYFFFKGNVYIAGGLKKKKKNRSKHNSKSISSPAAAQGVSAQSAHTETHAELSSLTPFRSDLPPHLSALGFDLACFLPIESPGWPGICHPPASASSVLPLLAPSRQAWIPIFTSLSSYTNIKAGGSPGEDLLLKMFSCRVVVGGARL